MNALPEMYVSTPKGIGKVVAVYPEQHEPIAVEIQERIEYLQSSDVAPIGEPAA